MSDSEPKKRKSINRRMYVLIALLVFFSAVFELVIASQHYFSREQQAFQEKNRQIAEATSSYFYDPSLAELAYLEDTPEFAEALAAAKKSGSRETIDKLFAEKKLDLYVSKTTEILTRVQDTFKIDSSYIAACDPNACTFLIGPHDYGLYEGEELPYRVRPEQLSHSQGAVSLNYDEYVEPGTYGSQRTVYFNQVSLCQIGEVDGDTRYCLVSESDIILFLADEISYFLQTLLFMIIVTTIFAVIGVAIMKRQLTAPIIHIKDSAVKFTTENSATQSAQPQDPGIRSNDELEDLSSSLLALEENVSETQGELRRISEERGRLQAELSIASSIQHGVLPTDFPNETSYEIYALMDPAREVGGDFYDFFRLDEERIALVIGDVSDKGIPAALFMMTAKAVLKAQAQTFKDPAEILAAVNRTLCDSNPAEMFVTVWIGILNLKTGLLTAANGGHEYPMFKLGNSPFEVMKDPHGLVVAAMETAKYKNYEVQLQPGDRLLVYSDGATDAVNTDRKDFGLERLLETVQNASVHPDAKGLIEEVRGTLMKYSEGATQFDDITMLGLTYFGPNGRHEPADMDDASDTCSA